MKKPERSADRKELLALVIAKGFSCTEMARHVLGAQWTALDQGERTEFVQLFRLILLKTYLHHIDRYAYQYLEYLEERTAHGRTLVRTRLMARDRDVVLDFWLFERAGEWKVYDVVVKGMSLIQNYRGQFTRVLRNSSYPHLVERMRETACLPDCNEQAVLGDHPPG
ncbi:MAG TPA: ABC transporter substrate-binding protein [Nitrospiraceae bacterium]|nr:ABC transporter substrate-binding protein [Nitrospiraceae bacterium]